jgi:hypothetical protein
MDLDPHSRSVRRFRQQDQEEGSPGGVLNRLGEHASSHSFHVQVFDGDQAVLVHELPRDLVMKISPLVANMCMYPLQGLHRFSASMTALLPASDPALGTSQPALGSVLI